MGIEMFSSFSQESWGGRGFVWDFRNHWREEERMRCKDRTERLNVRFKETKVENSLDNVKYYYFCDDLINNGVCFWKSIWVCFSSGDHTEPEASRCSCNTLWSPIEGAKGQNTSLKTKWKPILFISGCGTNKSWLLLVYVCKFVDH